MKYFTRELYQRCRSDDEAILHAACTEWEDANERYEEHMQAIELRLPPHLREFATLLLHDALVLSIAEQGKRLLMILHKDIPPCDLVILDYDLTADLVVEPFMDTPGDWSRPTDFQFDELEIVQEGEHPLYNQEIVFGNGWLMRIGFRDVRVTLAQPIYPTSPAASLASSAVLQCR